MTRQLQLLRHVKLFYVPLLVRAGPPGIQQQGEEVQVEGSSAILKNSVLVSSLGTIHKESKVRKVSRMRTAIMYTMYTYVLDRATSTRITGSITSTYLPQ